MILRPLAASPFRLQSMSTGAHAHASWRRAVTEALAAITRGESFAILGLPGTGKTLLLEHLAHRLRADGSLVAVRRPPASASCDPVDVLLVDEADTLSRSELREVFDRHATVGLAGLPEFARVLGAMPGPIVTVTLEPLSTEEVARFVVARLKECGRPPSLFGPEAIVSLAAHSAGLLRLVVVLAGSALFLAEQEGAADVTARHVDEAAALRIDADEPPAAEPVAEIDAPRRRGRRYAPILLSIAASTLAGIGLWAAAQHTGPAVQPTRPVQTAGLAEPTVAPIPIPPAPEPAPPQPLAPAIPETATAFQGRVVNVTMRQSGQLALLIRRREAGAVTVDFHASSGLIGTGQLTGTMTRDGRISVEGRLMMGRNPFDCVLSAVSAGDTLTGEANFTRVGTSTTARSTFTLAKRT